MKKLTLNLAALEVETFQVADTGRSSRGTAFGLDGATVPPYCVTFTCGDSVVRPCLD